MSLKGGEEKAVAPAVPEVRVLHAQQGVQCMFIVFVSTMGYRRAANVQPILFGEELGILLLVCLQVAAPIRGR